MVRTKAKKQKGDDAFQTKKQKVGRKKLAPATATRAEVHARTLRLSTSSALAHASTTAPSPSARRGAASAESLDHPSDRKRSRKEDAARAKEEAVMAHHSFSELIAASHHYKSANRASAFATIAKALAQQERNELAAAAAVDRFAGFVALPTTTGNKNPLSSVKTPSDDAARGNAALVTPLERLKAYSAALEAITDTDDDVRRAALSCLAVILRNQWISASAGATQGRKAERKGSRTARPSGGSQIAGDALASLADLEVAWPDAHPKLVSGTDGPANFPGLFGIASLSATEGGMASFMSSSSSTRHDRGCGSNRGHDVAEQDRMKAALQAVHIAFTHAMKAVRMSGVELLALLLANARPGSVALAARAVSRQQRAYLPSGGSGVGEQGGATRRDGEAVPGGDPLERAREDAKAEEEWILSLLKRLSQLVLRTKELYVLPWLLSSLFPSPITAGGGGDGTAWQNPELVAGFFSEVLPQWSNLWKELMELQLGLLRQEEKLQMAASLARAVAIILHFLKREQMERNAGQRQRQLAAAAEQQGQEVGGGENAAGLAGGQSAGARLLPKATQNTVKELFVHKVPITMEEILKSRGSSRGAGGGSTRVELGLALAQVCTPLAGTDEGWAVLRRFFQAILSPVEEMGKSGGGRASAGRPVALLHSLQVYLSILHLFPKRLHADVMPLHNEAVIVGAEEQGEEATVKGKKPTSSLSLVGSGDGGGGLWAAHSINFNTLDNNSGNSVFERLIPFAPGIVQGVVQHLSLAQQQRQSTVPSSAASTDPVQRAAATTATAREAATIAQLLLATSELVSLLAHYPLTAVKGGGESAATQHQMIGQAIADTLSLVPRLLFSLRPQKPQRVSVERAAAPPSRHAQKRLRSDSSNSDSSKEEEDTPARGGGGTGTETTTRDPTLLAEYPVLVDTLVQRFLQPLWFMASSGHPLLLASPSTAPTGQKSYRDSLRHALQPVFGMSLSPTTPPVVGVLARCTASTVALAQETMFYLGVRDAAKMTVWQGKDAGEEEGHGSSGSTGSNQGNGTGLPLFSLDDILAMLH